MIVIEVVSNVSICILFLLDKFIKEMSPKAPSRLLNETRAIDPKGLRSEHVSATEIFLA